MVWAIVGEREKEEEKFNISWHSKTSSYYDDDDSNNDVTTIKIKIDI